MFGRTLVLASGLISATVSSQLPEFSQQYRQRLGGAIDALSEVVEGFRSDAAQYGLSPEEAISRLENADEVMARRQGLRMETAIERLERLTRQRRAFEDAGSFARLAVLAADFDPQLAKATYETFEPAVPVTSEGALAAGLGGLLGVFGAGGLRGLGRRVAGKKRA